MKTNRAALTAGLMLLALLAGACTPAATPTPETVVVTQVVTQMVAGEPVEVEVTRVVEVTDEPDPEDVTLTVWFGSSSPEEIQLIRGLMDEWAAGYDQANVTVDFSTYAFQDLNNALKLSLDGHAGPDVAYSDGAAVAWQAYAAAGHVVDLTDVAAERGWTEHYDQDFLYYFNSAGRLYGIPYESVTVGVYYNKDLFAQHGLQPPATYEEFEALLAALKDLGLTPFAVGGGSSFPLAHVFDQFLHGGVPFAELQALWRNEPDAVWNSPEVVAAVTKFEEWIKAGYFNEGAAGTMQPDAINLFLTGQTAMIIIGSSNNATFNQQAEFDVGFFPFPRLDPALEYHMGGYTPNNVWGIPVYSRHQDIGLDLIDYMLSEDVALRRWQAGNTVGYQFETPPEPPFPLLAEVYSAMQQAKPGQYTVSGNAEVRVVVWAGLQEMMAGRLTAQQVMDQAQETFETWLSEQGN